jgi:hypothetical protein
MKALDNIKLLWDESSKNAKLVALGSLAVLGLIIFIQVNRNSEVQANLIKANAEAAAKAQIKNDPLNFSTVRTLPINNRNQGLEDEDKRINVLENELRKLLATNEDLAAKALTKLTLSQATFKSERSIDLNTPIDVLPEITFPKTPLVKKLSSLEATDEENEFGTTRSYTAKLKSMGSCKKGRNS